MVSELGFLLFALGVFQLGVYIVSEGCEGLVEAGELLLSVLF